MRIFGAPGLTDAELDELLAKARAAGDRNLRRLVQSYRTLQHIADMLLQRLEQNESGKDQLPKLARSLYAARGESAQHRSTVGTGAPALQMCSSQLIIVARAPSNCSASELADFAKLIREGGEVANAGLERRVFHAQTLFFVREDKRVVAIAALKRPVQAHRASVFKKAGALLSPITFPLELGWIFVAPGARGRGLSRQLVEAAIQHARGTPLFATTRTDNHPMQASLQRCGFSRHGSDYKSDLSSAHLTLFIFLSPAPAV